MSRTLYTIGYEGAEISQFLSTLRECGVERVIDIRDVPVSRKPGFSKGSLSAALEEEGIAYLHLKSLGDPKAGREAMRRGDYMAFLEIYGAHLASEESQSALRQAVHVAQTDISVLLCFERSPKECHRTIVANEMSKAADFKIQNLGVNKASNGTSSKDALPVGVAPAQI